MNKLILKTIASFLVTGLLIGLAGSQGVWIRKTDAPVSGGYGQAVVGTANFIYIARCFEVSSCDKKGSGNPRPQFFRYNPTNDQWQSLSTDGLPDSAFRNGTALAWDHDDYIYALLGARYEDEDRRLFYRYSISLNQWEPLKETCGPQGAGNALTFSNYDGKLYAFTGSNQSKPNLFASYDPATSQDDENCQDPYGWQILPYPSNLAWDGTDDGASLVAVGQYIYALQGEYDEQRPSGKFARFNIEEQRWESLRDLESYKENGQECGVGDGATLVWMPEKSDYIYATDGGCATGPKPGDEDPGKGFWRYRISDDQWEQLESLPCPTGFYNGARLGYTQGAIYYWQGSPTTDRWQCIDGDGKRAGKGFYMVRDSE